MEELHEHDNNNILEHDDIILEDDNSIIFPRASVDPKLIKLQKDVTEFITSVILKHEKEFYQLVTNKFDSKYEDILGYTRDYIIEMITNTTTKFYNKIYFDVQNKTNSPLTIFVLEMCEYADYGPHILLDKLFRLTLDAHLEISREDLIFSNNNNDLYQKSVLSQINIYLLSRNLLHVLSKGIDESEPFMNVPENEQPFKITIEKNINF